MHGILNISNLLHRIFYSSEVPACKEVCLFLWTPRKHTRQNFTATFILKLRSTQKRMVGFKFWFFNLGEKVSVTE